MTLPWPLHTRELAGVLKGCPSETVGWLECPAVGRCERGDLLTCTPHRSAQPVSEKSGHGRQNGQVFILSPKVKRGKTTSKGNRASENRSDPCSSVKKSPSELAVWLRKLKKGLCINLGGGMRWEMGGRFKREGIYVHLWLIHVEV